jgi:hypothetical protein
MDWLPITDAHVVDAFDSTEVADGYHDGRDNEPRPGANRSAAYRHGWWIGQRDGGHETDGEKVMCYSVIFEGERLDGIEDLWRVFGADNVFPAEDSGVDIHPLTPDECLCRVDMEATAKANGLIEEEHDGDPWEHIFVRPENAA